MYAAPGPPQQFDSGALQIDFGIERTDGQFMTYGEAFDRGLTPNFTDENGQVFESEEALRSGDPIGRDAMLVIGSLGCSGISNHYGMSRNAPTGLRR